MTRKRLPRNAPGTPTDGASPAQPAPSKAATLERGCHVATVGLVLVMLVIVFALSTSHVLWPDDQYSDMNTLMSGENLATHGLIRLRMLPVHYIGAMTDPPSYYTHYPPLPNIMNGLVRIVGIGSLPVMRVLCGLLCIAGLVCMYAAFSPLIGPLAATCGLAFVVTSGYFFTYCISVHQHTYNIFFIGVFLLCFMRAVHTDNPSRRMWAVCWLSLTLESLVSFEFILWPQAFAWVYLLATGQIRRRWRELVVLGTAPVAGVGLHFLQNCWAMGWSWALADAADAFRRPGRGPAMNRWEVLLRVPEFVLSHSQRLYYWPWPVLFLLGGAWPAISDRIVPDVTNRRRNSALLLALAAGSITWYFFMPIHTVKHPHTMSQLLVWTLVCMGCVLAIVLRLLAGRETSVCQRLLAVVALIVVVFGQTQSIADVFDRSGSRPETFYLFEAMGPTAFPEKVGCLTNTYADGQLAYFIRRPLWRCPDALYPFPESVTTIQNHLPADWSLRYYIFDTGGDREPYTLLRDTCVGEKVMILNSRSGRFLIIFDISPLHLPPEKRPKLDPTVLRNQREGRYPDHAKQHEFNERLVQVLRDHGKL